MAKYLNRLKVIQTEQHKTNLGLSQMLGRDRATVSMWCTNTSQPSWETLHVIADCLKIDERTLINPNEAIMASDPIAEYKSAKDSN